MPFNPALRTALPLAALALLGACSSKPDGELTPGQWKSTMAMTKFEVPGAPPAMQEQMKSMVGRTTSAESCMTPEEAKKGVRDFSKASQQGDCTFENYTQGGGKMSGTLKCKGSPFGDSGVKIDGTYTPEKVQMTMSGDFSAPGMPGTGKASMSMTVTSERVGDCPK